MLWTSEFGKTSGQIRQEAKYSSFQPEESILFVMGPMFPDHTSKNVVPSIVRKFQPPK